MDKRKQLYFLLKNYVSGNYNIADFSKEFYYAFYPDIPKEELSSIEYIEFNKLAYATARFSQYEEDFKNCPQAFVTASELDIIAKTVYKKLSNL